MRPLLRSSRCVLPNPTPDFSANILPGRLRTIEHRSIMSWERTPLQGNAEAVRPKVQERRRSEERNQQRSEEQRRTHLDRSIACGSYASIPQLDGLADSPPPPPPPPPPPAQHESVSASPVQLQVLSAALRRRLISSVADVASQGSLRERFERKNAGYGRCKHGKRGDQQQDFDTRQTRCDSAW